MALEIIQASPANLDIAEVAVTVETTEAAPAALTIEQQAETVVIQQQAQTTVEITSGGPVGPSGNPATAAEADETIAIGQPVWVKSTTHVGLARADAQSTARVGGIATTAATIAVSVDYVTDGVIEMADWTSVIGAMSLTPGSTYYLSAATAGRLTATAPTVSGFVVAVGRALNSTTLDIEISQPVRL